MWGLFILAAFELADIATGDPFSLNGAIKMVLWASGTGLVLWGRSVKNIQPLKWW